MKQGHFIWTDLSTYNVSRAQEDYAKLFGWSFVGSKNYRFAMLRKSPVAAVFKMPKRLARMNMPSFWMSYIKVLDLDVSVAQARRVENTIIEMEPTPFNEARIALVRDPSGAGFTLYEGPDIAPATNLNASGYPVERVLHVPNISKVEQFYNTVFGWTFHQSKDLPWPIFDIRHTDGKFVAKAEQVPKVIRGKFCYWTPSFSISSQEQFLNALTNIKGTIYANLGGRRLLVADRQQAHFIVQVATGESGQ